MNSVFLRDSTGISDSVLLLFGGDILTGGLVSSEPILVPFSSVMFFPVTRLILIVCNDLFSFFGRMAT